MISLRRYIIHPGIGVARIGSRPLPKPMPDPCQPIIDSLQSVGNEIVDIQNALDTGRLTNKQRADAQQLLAQKNNELTQLTDALDHCRNQNPLGDQAEGGYFIGPEVPDEGFVPPGNAYRDADNNIRRQAARFRIYEYTVFYSNFQQQAEQALDGLYVGRLPMGTQVREITAKEADVRWHIHLANTKATDLMGNSVANDPGEKTIAGVKQTLAVTGQIFNDHVQLGTLATDDDGRLQVLGGFGKSRSPSGTPLAGLFNSLWYDDMSDGPVRATITLHDSGEQPPVEPAWVIVGVPGFAHPIPNIVTLHDLAYDVARRLPQPYTLVPPIEVSFTNDIYPLLRRPVLMQWVSALARQGHSGQAHGNFFDPQLFNLLKDNNPNAMSAAYQARTLVFEALKNPAGGGDDMPRLALLTVTPFQYLRMRQWSNGNFVADWQGPPQIVPLNQLPSAQQPAALDKAGLITAVGGAFAPGIEAGRIMGDVTTYGKALRIRPDLAPGSLTAQLSIPWQADYTACGTGWWPAGRPNQVTHDGMTFYEWKPLAWGMPDMVEKWSQLGFIARRQINNQDAFVETERLAPQQ
jgi:hypothetical protein